jgi:hypothetical protein
VLILTAWLGFAFGCLTLTGAIFLFPPLTHVPHAG